MNKSTMYSLDMDIVGLVEYSGNAMVSLDKVMQQKNWQLNLWFVNTEGIYVAIYRHIYDSRFIAEGKSKSMPKAVALAAYDALSRKELQINANDRL